MPEKTLSLETIEKAKKLNTVEGAAAVASDNLAAPYIGLFALALGATPSQIGMLNAFPSLIGNLLQIPYGILADRIKDPRLLCIIGGFFARLGWAFFIIPLFFPMEYRVMAVIIIATWRVVMANLGGPAWSTLQSKIIPRAIRGQYYASRGVAVNISILLITFLAGILLDIIFPLNYMLIFIIAAILGVISTGFFMAIPFPKSTPKSRSKTTNKRINFKDVSYIFGSNKNFANYTLSAFAWNCGFTAANSLYAVYFVKNLGGNEGLWAIVTAASILAQVFCQRYWGRLADQFGQKSVLSVTGLGIIFIPIMWLLAPVSLAIIPISFISGLGWGGYNLSAFNLLLELTPDENRSMYIGVYNAIMGIAMALGPIIGGFSAEVVGLRVVFVFAFIMQGIGLFLLNRNVKNSSDTTISYRDLLPRKIKA